ncbi:MAG: glutaredoxin family protein [Gordonia sp. (in: high G+C Gram-positive bacteria)]
MALTLLTRAGCHACLAAAADLRRICSELATDFATVDVDEAAAAGDRELRAEYGDRLPVVLLDGEEHSYWEVDEARLRADLAARTRP